MVTPTSGRRERRDAAAPAPAPERAQAPIRWPHPSLAEVGLVALWVAGLALALFVPALIVSPGVRFAPPRDVWTAFTVTVAGALLMLVAASLLWRRTHDYAYMIMGGVPAATTIIGAAILAASKLTGT